MIGLTGQKKPKGTPPWGPHELPDDLYFALVGTLFKAKSSLVVSAIVSALVSFKIAISSGNNIILGFAALVVVMAIARLWVAARFPYYHQPATDRRDVRHWEKLAALTSIAHSAAFGVIVFITFMQVNNLADNLLADATACGLGSGITSRSAGRPMIGAGQLSVLIFPIFVACILHLTASYYVLALLNILFFVGSLGICRSLNANILELLVTKRETTILASSLASKNALLDATLDNMSHGLCVYDARSRTVLANRRYMDLLRLPPELVQPGVPIRDVIGHGLKDEKTQPIETIISTFEQNLASGTAQSVVWRTRDGCRLALTQKPTVDGGAVVVFEDVTERDRMEARIAHMARHDTLTGLPNRAVFNERLHQDLETLSDDRTVTLFCLDLDHFKNVNDTLGHIAGDTLLSAVAQRIRGTIVDGMLPARIGGDEFVIIARDMENSRAIAFAESLVEILSMPYQIDEGQVSIGVSIGAGFTARRGTCPRVLFSQADKALYRAKQSGRGRVCLISTDAGDQSLSHRALETELRLAV